MAQDWHECVLIGNRDRGDPAVMATLAEKIKAEQRMRELLEKSDLPQPDFVEYGFTCIRLFYNEAKVVVVIDIDEPGDPEASDDVNAA